ncbi:MULTISPECIES: ArsR/SmtB family transcription factor [unclassified Isoptericola]|uniref:ArsR/SmtB family transcription factor n=1 Tax=Isoptericola sp. NPDC057191 TaxID=3346041 RepID=UPI00363EAB5E
MLETSMDITEPEALRALANPVRQRILMQLAVMDHARAADLAEAIGHPANSVSFHLRVLAKAGMIVEAPEHARDKRDRVWTNAAGSFNVKTDTPASREAVLRPAMRWASDVFINGHRDDESVRRQFMTSSILLTKEEADALATEVHELLNRWGDRTLAAARAEPEVVRETYQVLNVLGPRDDVHRGTEAPAQD